MELNLVFCGRFGSGKTQLSRAVAANFGARWASFGQTLKNIARERDIPINRESLQTLGEDLVRNAPDKLVRRVLTEAEPNNGEPIVIDGLRHASIHTLLSQLSVPRKLFCVFVDVADDIRIERLKSRDNITESEIRRVQMHSTEAEVTETVRELADYVVDNSRTPDIAVAEIIKWLSDLDRDG